jgi:hypothetical protein
MTNLLITDLLLLNTTVYCEKSDYYALIVSLMSLCLALIALIFNREQARNEEYQMILEIMFKKAEICNSYITLDKNYRFPKEDEASVSAIISVIITAYQITNIQKNIRLLTFGKDRQRLLDTFYLMLHTSIRQYINPENNDCRSNEGLQAMINRQIDDIQKNFKAQIRKYG